MGPNAPLDAFHTGFTRRNLTCASLVQRIYSSARASVALFALIWSSQPWTDDRSRLASRNLEPSVSVQNSKHSALPTASRGGTEALALSGLHLGEVGILDKTKHTKFI